MLRLMGSPTFATKPAFSMLLASLNQLLTNYHHPLDYYCKHLCSFPHGLFLPETNVFCELTRMVGLDASG